MTFGSICHRSRDIHKINILYSIVTQKKIWKPATRVLCGVNNRLPDMHVNRRNTYLLQKLYFHVSYFLIGSVQFTTLKSQRGNRGNSLTKPATSNLFVLCVKRQEWTGHNWGLSQLTLSHWYPNLFILSPTSHFSIASCFTNQQVHFIENVIFSSSKILFDLF